MINSISKDFQLYSKDKGVNPNALHKYANIMQPSANYLTPNIIEERQLNVASMSVFDRLMMDRTLFLGVPIDDTVSNIIVAQLLYLSSLGDEDISLYLNSPGGQVYSGLAIKSTMDFITPDISTVVCGMSASMSFVLGVCGTKGKRKALNHSRLMMHQPLGGAQGQASDIQIQAKQIQLVKDELYQIIAERTGQSLKKIIKDADRDYWMTSVEAKNYGAIDEVIGVDV